MRRPSMGVTLACTTMAWATSGSAASAADTNLEVLGIHYADPSATSATTLQSNQFELAEGYERCSTTFEEAVKMQMSSWLNSREMCQEQWRDKADRRVEIIYFMTVNGYKVSEVSYTFPYSGTTAELTAQLQKKFGPPKGAFKAISGMLPQFSTGAALASNVFVRPYSSGTVGTLTMAPKVSRDRAAAEKLIAAEIARRKGSNTLKL